MTNREYLIDVLKNSTNEEIARLLWGLTTCVAKSKNGIFIANYKINTVNPINSEWETLINHWIDEEKEIAMPELEPGMTVLVHYPTSNISPEAEKQGSVIEIGFNGVNKELGIFFYDGTWNIARRVKDYIEIVYDKDDKVIWEKSGSQKKADIEKWDKRMNEIMDEIEHKRGKNND